MNEVWKEIEGYERIYEISSEGRVRSLDRIDFNGHRLKGRIKKTGMGTSGYYQVILYKNGIHKNHLIHQLVAKAFIPNPENKQTVNHIDGNKFNNKASNLEWNTYKENMNHAIDNGLKHDIGEKHHKAKLTEKQVDEIYKRIILGEKTKRLADEFGVAYQTIYDIKIGRRWRAITHSKVVGGGFLE